MINTKLSGRGELLRRWLKQAYAWKGSYSAIAQIMGVHTHTISRIVRDVDGQYQSNGSKETVRAFQEGFNISDEEYLLGPERYKKPGAEQAYYSDRITLAYQLSKLKDNLGDIPSSLFVISFQHLDNFFDFFLIIVDLPDRGLEHGVQAVINKSRKPHSGDKVLVWHYASDMEAAYASFVKWDEFCPPPNSKVLGVCVSTIG